MVCRKCGDMYKIWRRDLKTEVGLRGKEHGVGGMQKNKEGERGTDMYNNIREMLGYTL